jgi:predicted PurR-regulated permease PerM
MQRASPPPVPAAEDGWWSRERALVLVLAAGTVLAVYVCYRMALPFLPAMSWALALAIMTRPLHRRIAARVRHAGLAAGLSIGLILVLLIGPMLLLAHSLSRELARGVELLENEASNNGWQTNLPDVPYLESALAWLDQHLDVEQEARRAAGMVLPDVAALMTGSVWAVAQLLIMLLVLYYFLRDHRKILQFVQSLLPLSAAESEGLFRRVADTVHATIYGTLLVAAVQGALGGLVFWWLGLPAPLLWGLVMGLLAVVPYLGAFVIWAPAAAILFLQGSWSKGLMLTFWGLVVIGLIDNLLYPALVGNRLRMHTLPVFFAIVGGLALFGVAGVVLGPVVLAITTALLGVWQERTRRGGTAETGVREPP